MSSISKEVWLARATESTRRARLFAHTAAGLPIEPVYGVEDRPAQALLPETSGAARIAVPWRSDQPLDGVDGVLLSAGPVPQIDRPILLDHPDAEIAAQLATSASEGCLGQDPIGRRQADRWDAIVDWMNGPRRVLRMSGARFPGAPPVDQLALLLANLIDTLRILDGRGIAPERAAAGTTLTLLLDCDQFGGIAMLRAVRALWRQVADTLGIDAPIQIHAETDPQVITRYDPWVNLLRGTITAFSAVVGGADWVTVAPFRANDPLAARLARNTSLILQQEAGVDGSFDAAQGCWYLEQLSAALAQEAWKQVQAIEAAGGLQKALGDGALEQRLVTAREERQRKVRTRAHPITGVSIYPSLEEPRPAPLAGPRHAEPFEALRDAPEASILVAELGAPSDHAARSRWTQDLFAAGGIRAEPRSVTSETVAATFAAVDARAAVLCGTDEAYAEQAPSIIAALRAAGAEPIFLAGPPTEAYRPDHFVHLGCDVVTCLEAVKR